MGNRNFPFEFTEKNPTVIWLKIINWRQKWRQAWSYSNREDTSLSVSEFQAIHPRRGSRLGRGIIYSTQWKKYLSLFITKSLLDPHRDRSAFSNFRDPGVWAVNGLVSSCPHFLPPSVNLQGHGGSIGIGVKHARVQAFPRLFAICGILNNFLSLLEIQLTHMELILPNP